jgi:hypothetical protein
MAYAINWSIDIFCLDFDFSTVLTTTVSRSATMSTMKTAATAVTPAPLLPVAAQQQKPQHCLQQQQ